MCLPCLPLVSTAPLRPVQMQGHTGCILQIHQMEQPSDLGDAIGNEAYYVPFFAVALRAMTKAAYANIAKVIWRYHACARRTSYSSKPTSPLAPSKATSICQRCPATASRSGSAVVSGP